MAYCVERACVSMRMGLFTRGCGKMDHLRDLEFLNMEMEVCMRESGGMERNREKGRLNGQAARFMKESGKMMKATVMENAFTKIYQFTMDSLVMTKGMAVDY